MTQFKSSNKARFWLHVAYPENMIDNWEEKAADLLEVPFAYCIHYGDKSVADEDRKTHVHFITAWTTGGQTKKRAWETIENLAKPGRTCSVEPRPSGSIEHSYKYLIHDTESAQKAGKHLYSTDERITGNSFDIDRYIVLDADQKEAMAKELCDYIIDRMYKDSASAYMGIRRDFDESYFAIYKANNAMLDRLCRGNFLKWERKKKVLSGVTCIVCGSHDILGSFDVDGEKVWFCKEHQETAYTILNDLGL